MIQPNEIRIGNYVYLQKSNTFYQITEITQSEVEDGRYEATGVSDDSIFHTFTDNINPIPLTEDVLLKCGFEKYIEDGYTYYKKSDFFHLKVFNESGDISYECGDNLKGNYIHFRVDYLHTLQNLYFLLTNQELEIEL